MKEEKIMLAHGDGGLLTRELIEKLFLASFGPESSQSLDDAAILATPPGRIAFTTDAFVVKPLFFPGGDIGKLSVCGTVNDLAVSGALPRYLSASFILEEGLEMSILRQVVASMSRTAREAGVKIVAGDTKVVEKGNADALFITTTGIGYLPEKVHLGYEEVCPGDLLVVNGNIGDHGAAILTQREEFAIETPVVSDCSPLNQLIMEILKKFATVRFMRDPTRGGLATTVKELALGSQKNIVLWENELPVSTAVAAITAMLGLDPLYLANEGKVLLVVSPAEVQELLAFIRSQPLGRGAAIVGEIKEGTGEVFLKTMLGGTRNLEMLAGPQLPRIC